MALIRNTVIDMRKFFEHITEISDFLNQVKLAKVMDTIELCYYLLRLKLFWR